MSIAARSLHLCVSFFEKFDSLLDCLNNGCMMHSSQNGTLEWARGSQNDAHYCSRVTLKGCKYLLHLALITISHSFPFSRLGFTFLAFCSRTMEDKRGTKCASSPSREGSPSPSGAPTPPPVPSGSPPPLGSPSKVSSHRPRSPVFEQGVPLRRLQWWIFLRL
jgi:hypothetical protein